MKHKKLIAVLTAICLISTFAACTQVSEKAATNEVANTLITLTEEEEVSAQIASVDSEEISFYQAQDNASNTLLLSPIYDKEGKNVVAAYIISGKDKNGKDLTAESFALLNCVVSAKSTEKSILFTYDSNKKLVKIESYADKNGNLVALKDINDINANKNKDEFIKLSRKTNKDGSVHFFLTDSVLEIKKEDGKKFIVEDDKKTEVKEVNSKNKDVKKKVEKDTASKKEKKEIESGKKPEVTVSTTKKDEKSKTETTTAPAEPEKEYQSIVLKKNGNASSSASGVSISTNEVVINNPGDYKITSETDLWHGCIKLKLKNTESAELRFEDVDISYNKGSVIQLIDESDTSDRSFIESEATAGTVADDAIEALSQRDSAPNVSISFPTGTKSTFENSANVYTGVLYNEAKLTIKGNGSAVFKSVANANNVISTSKSITIKNLTLSLQSASADLKDSIGGARGIFSYSKVNVESGKLLIASNGDGIRCDSYHQDGGTVSIASSACDGIDADDEIYINGGTLKLVALNKTALKVRRVNNQDRLESYLAAGTNVSSSYKKTCIRDGKTDGFEINGGIVSAEGAKMSTPRNSSQKVILCKASKEVKGNPEESKKAVKWNISDIASSDYSTIKFLYSSSSVSQKNYSVTVDGSSKETFWNWNDNVGVAKVISSTTG